MPLHEEKVLVHEQPVIVPQLPDVPYVLHALAVPVQELEVLQEQPLAASHET